MTQRKVLAIDSGHQVFDELDVADVPDLSGSYATSGAIASAVAAEASARNTAIAAAVASLIASSPGALDTLNELAAALGNDPNFAATVTTALAGKQPLDADLTAIAAVATTSFGRALLALADAAAMRTASGSVIGTNVQAWDADLDSLAAVGLTAAGLALLDDSNAAAQRTTLGLGTAATSASSAFDASGAAAAAQAASQPLDSDLTAIAALSTTSFGRALLALADASALRTTAGLGTAALSATGDFDAAGAAATAQAAAISAAATDATTKANAAAAASQPVDSDLTAFAGLAIAADKLPYGTGSHTLGLADFTAAGRALVDDADAAAQRTTLGLGSAALSATSAFDAAGAASAAQAAAIAASQPVDSDLTAIAALTTTSYGRAFLALADAAAARTAVGLVIGTDVEAHDADLTTIAGLTPTNDDVIQRKAGAWTNRTIAQLLTDLGIAAAYQPLDSDLTAIAALATTSFGRALLVLADAAAMRTAAGLGTLATQSGTFSGTSSGTNTGDQDVSALTSKAKVGARVTYGV